MYQKLVKILVERKACVVQRDGKVHSFTASSVINGRGGGPIIEGWYAVYEQPGGVGPIKP